MALDKHFQGDVRAAFIGGKFYLSIGSIHNYFKVDISRSLLEAEAIRVFYEEFKHIVELVELLDFNTRIWTKP